MMQRAGPSRFSRVRALNTAAVVIFLCGDNLLALKNVVYHYTLARAMDDGFVKEPAVVTRKDFNPAGIPPYKLWVLGDPGQRATYTISITWFRGPDC